MLQERDRHLLRELSVMRVLDREQAKIVAGFRSITRVNRRLLALTQAGLLKRFFIGTIAGGKKALYSLSSLGAKVVQVPYRSPRRRQDEIVTVGFFLYHQLGINQIYCLLKYAPIPVEGARLVRWESSCSLIDSQRSLIPDAYLEIFRPNEPIGAFLEFDRGHEHLRVWKEKVHKYVRYAISGDFERAFHHPQFRVLVVTDSERRREALRKATAAITDKVFWFTTSDSIHPQGFWSPIWFRPRVDHEPISLL